MTEAAPTPADQDLPAVVPTADDSAEATEPTEPSVPRTDLEDWLQDLRTGMEGEPPDWVNNDPRAPLADLDGTPTVTGEPAAPDAAPPEAAEASTGTDRPAGGQEQAAPPENPSAGPKQPDGPKQPERIGRHRAPE